MIRSTLTVGVCFLIPLLTTFAGTNNPNSISSPNTVIAEVNGKKITLGEFEGRHADKLFQAQNTYYQAERKVLDEFIGQSLLEQQAQRENVSVEELLNRHVKSTLPPDPPEEALRVYYEGLDVNQPFEAVRDQIIAHLHQRRFEKAKTAYLQSLRSQANVVISLPPPKADIALKDTPVRGVANAPVVVVEFADYECPYCQQVNPDLKKLEEEYKGKVAFAYKDTPLPSHPHAQKAAEAAHCAGVQGKYWEYHDLLFVSKQYEIPDLKQGARKLNLDSAAFDQCLDSGAQAGAIKAHLAEAEKLGLSGTPSFFINGRFLSGAVDYATLHSVVEQELAAVGQTKETSRAAATAPNIAGQKITDTQTQR
jgi:protein-disulfide isomerase